MGAVHAAAAHKGNARTAAERQRWASQLATEQIKDYAARALREQGAARLTETQILAVVRVLRGTA